MCILRTEGSEILASIESEVPLEPPTGFHQGAGPVVEALNEARTESEVQAILAKWAESQKEPD